MGPQKLPLSYNLVFYSSPRVQMPNPPDITAGGLSGRLPPRVCQSYPRVHGQTLRGACAEKLPLVRVQGVSNRGVTPECRQSYPLFGDGWGQCG